MVIDENKFQKNLDDKIQTALNERKAAATAQNDLRGFGSFGKSFSEARKRGLKQFKWGDKGMVYTTEMASDASKGRAANKTSSTNTSSTTVAVSQTSPTNTQPANKSSQQNSNQIVTNNFDSEPEQSSKESWWNKKPWNVVIPTAGVAAGAIGIGALGGASLAQLGSNLENTNWSFWNRVDNAVDNNNNPAIKDNNARVIKGKSPRAKAVSRVNPKWSGKLLGKLGVLGSISEVYNNLFGEDPRTQYQGASVTDQASGKLLNWDNNSKRYVEDNGIDSRYPNYHKQGGILNNKEMNNKSQLNYIIQLKGKCPEGYETMRFEKGGVVCSVCKKKEEAMKGEKGFIAEFKKDVVTKKAQKGVKVTTVKKETKYKDLPLEKKIEIDKKDLAKGKSAEGTGATDPIKNKKTAKKANGGTLEQMFADLKNRK